MPSNTRSLGFTLIEVVVTLALMALISTILIASLQFAGHGWQRVVRVTHGAQEVAQAEYFLREHLSDARLITELADGAQMQPAMVSDGSYIEFSGTASGESGDVVRYRIERDPRSSAIVVRYRSPSATGLTSDWTVEPLLDKAASLRIEFLDSSDFKNIHWLDAWTQPRSVPTLVKIDVTFLPDAHASWPTLYVKTRNDAPPNCEFDLVGRRCRTRG